MYKCTNIKNKVLLRCITAVFLSIIVLFASACEAELTEASCTVLGTAVEMSVWKEAAVEVTDVESENISLADLVEGSTSARIVNLTLHLNLSGYRGYQWLFCDFNLTASADADLTLEVFVREGADGERVSHGKTEYNLLANEKTEISLATNFGGGYDAVNDLTFEIEFSSSLPFTPEVEGGESLDFVSWATTMFSVSNLRFYGAQTTAV